MQSPNTVDACSLHASSKAVKAWITGLLAACIAQCKVCGLQLAAELCMQEVLADFAVCIFLRSNTGTALTCREQPFLQHDIITLRLSFQARFFATKL